MISASPNLSLSFARIFIRVAIAGISPLCKEEKNLCVELKMDGEATDTKFIVKMTKRTRVLLVHTCIREGRLP